MLIRHLPLVGLFKGLQIYNIMRNTISQYLRNAEGEVKKMALYFPSMAGEKALRFINGNFRAQGYQGNSFNKWAAIKRKGTILVKTGNLRRSIRSEVRGMGVVAITSNAPYAKVHNEGFSGTVQVGPFKRRITGKAMRYSVKTRKRLKDATYTKGFTDVSAHTRKVNIKQRQFAPITPYDSPVLNNAIRREIIKQLQSFR